VVVVWVFEIDNDSGDGAVNLGSRMVSGDGGWDV